MLGPDPDPYQMKTDPKLWCLTRAVAWIRIPLDPENLGFSDAGSFLFAVSVLFNMFWNDLRGRIRKKSFLIPNSALEGTVKVY